MSTTYPIKSEYGRRPTSRLLIGIITLVDTVTIAFIGAFGPIGGTVGLLGVGVMTYCVFSPIGLVLILGLVSQVASIDPLEFSTLRLVKWILIGFFLMVTVARFVIEEKKLNLRFGTVEKYFILIMGWGILCSLFAVHPVESLIDWIRISTFLVIYSIARITLQTGKHVQTVFVLMLVAVLASCSYSLFSFSMGTHVRVRGFLANPNSFGIFLCYTVPLLIAALSIFRHGLVKMLFATGICIGILSLLLSWSRASWGAFFLSMIVFLLVERRFKLLISLLMAFLILAASIGVSPQARSVFYTLGRLQGGSTHRTLLWQSGVESITMDPIFGRGSMLTNHDVSGRVLWGNLEAASMFSDLEHQFDPHNFYIMRLLASGVPGLILILLFYRVLFGDLFAARKAAQTSKYRALYSAEIAILAGTLFAGFFESGGILGSGSMANYLWISLGLAEACKERNLFGEK